MTSNHRLATWSLLALLSGLWAGAALSAWLPALLVAGGAAAALALVCARRWLLVLPALALLVGVVRGATGPPPPPYSTSSTPAQALLVARLDASVGPPESNLGASLLLGARTGLPSSLIEDFRASGLSHVLAVSGYNVTLIAGLLARCVSWLPRRYRTGVVVVGIAVFVLAAGASAAVVRAGVMGGLAAIALHGGRASAGRRTLLVAAAAMAALQPSLLVADVGFLLSVAATFSILVLASRLDRLLRWLPDVLALRSSLALTISATLGTLPIVLVAFGRFAPASLVANLVAAPLVPPAMATSAAAALAAGTPFAAPIGFVAGSVLRSLVLVAHVFAQVPQLGTVATMPQ